MDCPHVLYACYGSNLLGSRFLAYILGGQVSETSQQCASKLHDGARDPTSPRISVSCSVPYKLRFARSSSRWFHGGVAFLDVSSQVPSDDEATVVRGWPLSASQFIDVLRQENALKVVHSKSTSSGHAVGSHAAEDADNPVTMGQLRELLSSGPGNGLELRFHDGPAGPLVEGSGWYSWLHYLADDPKTGLPMLTFTCNPSYWSSSSSDAVITNSPSVQYGRVIFKGLLECHPGYSKEPQLACDYLNKRAFPASPSSSEVASPCFTVEQLLEREVFAEYHHHDRHSTTDDGAATVSVEGKGAAALVLSATATTSASSAAVTVIPVLHVGGVLRPSTPSCSSSSRDASAAAACPVCSPSSLA